MSGASLLPILCLAVLPGLTPWCGAASAAKIRIIDFESATTMSWAPFVPPESEQAECTIVRDDSVAHGGGAAAKLSSAAFARYGIRFKSSGMAVKPGDRFRISAWVRPDATFATETGTPGVLIRFTLFDQNGADFSGGHRYAAVGGDVRSVAEQPSRAPLDPGEWCALAAEITVPEGVATIEPMLFVWRGRGVLWVDDLRCERMAAE